MNKLGVAFIVCASLLIILLPHIFKSTYSSSANVSAVVLSATSTSPVVTHVSTPNQVKAIYITACVAGTPSLKQRWKRTIAGLSPPMAAIFRRAARIRRRAASG